MLNTVEVPKQFKALFEKAQDCVDKYFKAKQEMPSRGIIEIFGERYLLVRAASMSVDFFETVKNLYKDKGEEEARNVAKQLLFDIAHATGKEDAKNFHNKMKLKNPMEKLSVGPVHFAYSGWAFVNIFPESRPLPNENFYLIYDHSFSFESDAWGRAGKKSDFPVCIMNAGYSSGWCEESFGVTLVASEIMCKAKGDKVCRFIMAHPSKIKHYIEKYTQKEPVLAKKVTKYEIPSFFKVKQMEKERNEIAKEKEKLLYGLNERVKELNCLYGLSTIVESSNITLEGIFQEAVKIIPFAWQYPDITCARITFEDKEFKTDDFRKEKWRQSADIVLFGKKKGSVEVFYVEEKPNLNGGPCL